MDARSLGSRALRGGLVALACLVLLAGCLDTAGPPSPDDGPTVGSPVTDYESVVFDVSPSSTPVITGGITINEEFDEKSNERYAVTLLTNTTETERFNRSQLPADAREFVDAVTFENESLVVIQAFPASSVPDYRVESIARDGPTLHLSIDDASDGGTDDVTVETVLVRVPGETPDNVIVTTEDGETFEIGSRSTP